MADYVRDSEHEVIPITSCHSAVAYWIVAEEQLEPSDEIVLLGPKPDKDLVFHSILMRGDDIIGDTERSAENRQIDTTYDAQTGVYKTKMSNKEGSEEVSYQTLLRISLSDFKQQYVEENNTDLDITDPNAGFDL
ncbi:MAG: hypothetical protein COA45_01420 [Zetaproteobacteria bacterium]|nr:MAG: hypothetical protein COA45_01420 [Zetaproteobacteria bacterium]